MDNNAIQRGGVLYLVIMHLQLPESAICRG